ncbi:MAG TPA: VWA domain-containing protein [Chloroflexota bacterium]|nr:VWA domain-containing protein [Chloroflexota bacterium]
MTFASPVLLWGLLLIPAAVAAYAIGQRRRTRFAVRFTNLDLLANLTARTPAWRRHVPPVLYLLALATLLLSLARPQAMVPVPKEEATVVMVMDTSGSMAATDVQPSRLLAARAAGRTFLDQLPPSFRVAIVSFSGTAETLLRPTTDRAAARNSFDLLRAEGGTAMGDGIMRAIDLAEPIVRPDAAAATTPAPGATPTPRRPALPALPTTPPATATPAPPAGQATPGPSATPQPAAILLLSDGANTSGRADPLRAAERARQLGIPIYTIALGTSTGTVNVMGQRLRVPPDTRTLQEIAEITDGQYFSAPSAAELQAVYRDIGSRIGFVYEPREVTAAFAGVGAALLLAGSALALAWYSRFP